MNALRTSPRQTKRNGPTARPFIRAALALTIIGGLLGWSATPVAAAATLEITDVGCMSTISISGMDDAVLATVDGSYGLAISLSPDAAAPEDLLSVIDPEEFVGGALETEVGPTKGAGTIYLLGVSATDESIVVLASAPFESPCLEIPFVWQPTSDASFGEVPEGATTFEAFMILTSPDGTTEVSCFVSGEIVVTDGVGVVPAGTSAAGSCDSDAADLTGYTLTYSMYFVGEDFFLPGAVGSIEAIDDSVTCDGETGCILTGSFTITPFEFPDFFTGILDVPDFSVSLPSRTLEWDVSIEVTLADDLGVCYMSLYSDSIEYIDPQLEPDVEEGLLSLTGFAVTGKVSGECSVGEMSGGIFSEKVRSVQAATERWNLGKAAVARELADVRPTSAIAQSASGNRPVPLTPAEIDYSTVSADVVRVVVYDERGDVEWEQQIYGSGEVQTECEPELDRCRFYVDEVVAPTTTSTTVAPSTTTTVPATTAAPTTTTAKVGGTSQAPTANAVKATPKYTG